MEKVVRAAHLCVDMQKIFAKGGLWETPWMERVLPTIEAIVDRYREQTIFSRFITPLHAEDRPGQWQHYFRRWEKATRWNLKDDQLDLVPEMSRHVPRRSSSTSPSILRLPIRFSMTCCSRKA